MRALTFCEKSRGAGHEPRAEKTEDRDSGETAALRDLSEAQPAADHDAGALDLCEVWGAGVRLEAGGWRLEVGVFCDVVAPRAFWDRLRDPEEIGAGRLGPGVCVRTTTPG